MIRSSSSRRASSFEEVGYAVLLEFVEDIGAAREIAEEDALAVADGGRSDVFIGRGIADHGAHVDAALVGESAMADVGLVVAERQIGQFRDEARHGGEAGELAGADTVWPSLSSRFGMMEHRLALPQRSPYPLMQP